MKFLALMAFAGVAAGCTPMPSTAQYRFHEAALGLGNYSYDGPVDQGAVKAYVKDTKTAVDAVQANPAVSRAIFNVGTGTLVVDNAETAAPTNADMAGFARSFQTRHVMLRHIIYRTYGGRMVENKQDILKGYGGTARYRALRAINISDPSAHRPSGAALKEIQRALIDN